MEKRKKAGIVMILASRLMNEVAREFRGRVQTPAKVMRDENGVLKRISPTDVIGNQAMKVVNESEKLVKLIDENMIKRNSRNQINDMAYLLTEIFRNASYLPIDEQEQVLEAMERRNEE